MSGVFSLPVAAIVFIVIALDQAAKFFIVQNMRLGESIPVWAGFFHITYIENPGAAFGIFADQRWMFIFAGVAVIAAACVMHRRIEKMQGFARWGAALLMGGAAGNLIDRVRLGSVIDFFDFLIWPVFNIADIGICVGVACLMYALLQDEEKERE